MSLSTLKSNPLNSNNESDFFKWKFADFNSLERQLKDWEAIKFVQLKICTSKLNKDISNREEVSLKKYEIIRYESVHYSRSHKHVVVNSIVFHMQLGLELVSLDANVFLLISVKKNHFELLFSCE
jgi:hypothetical protein